MSSRMINRLNVVFVLAVFAAATFLMPVSANAAWDNNWDGYPGHDSPPWGTIIAIGVVGGLAIAGIAYLARDKNKDEEAGDLKRQRKETEDSESEADGESSADVKNSAKSDRYSSETFAKQGSQLGFYFDVDQLPGQQAQSTTPDFSDMTVKVGVSLTF